MKIVLLFLSLGAFGLAQPPALDSSAIRRETLEHFQALVRIDSSNPPGNETRVVEYLQKVFAQAGIPTQIFALEPARANLVARLKGNGKKRPLLLMAHTDVVGVQREKWPVDPFGAVLQDGFLWGRGSTDDKDKLAANLMTMLLARRSGVVLDRDLIFLAEAGEEGTTGPGIDFMAERHFDAIDAEFAITEGGDVSVQPGLPPVVRLATTEKLPRRVRLVATGTSGHGSIPRPDNAVAHLAAAVAKVAAWQTPINLNETTRTYFERLADIVPSERAGRYRALVAGKSSAEAEQYLAANEGLHYSMLRASLSPTMLKAGIGPNVIPSEAEATIDIRLTPGEDADRFFTQMAKVIADASVRIVPLAVGQRTAGAPSKLDTDMFRALEAAAKHVYPGAVTLPFMLTGATDMAQLRAKGIQSYGVGAATTPEEFSAHGPHSDVERAELDSVYRLTEFIWRAVREVAGPQ